MKTPIGRVLPALIALIPLVAVAAGDRITEQVPVKYFDDIELGGGVRLIVVQGETPELQVTATEELMERVRVVQTGNRLELGLKTGMSGWFDWLWHGTSGDVLFEIQTPDLKHLGAGGASKVKIGDIQLDNLRLDLSGASHMSANRLTLNDLGAGISGASHLDVGEMEADNVQMGLSGASKGMIGSLRVRVLKLDASGASGLKVSGGKAEYVTVDVSGASGYDGSALQAGRVKARASGASRINVHADESLETESSGGSHITNNGNPAN